MAEQLMAELPPAATSGTLASTGMLHRVMRSMELWVSAAIVILIILACFVWPEIYAVPNPVVGQLTQANLPPFSLHHILGTDPLGEDNLARLLYGGRISLEIGFGAVAIGLVVGGAVGVFSAYWGGLVDTIVARFLDMFLALPSLVLAIVISTYLGPSELHVIWAVSLYSMPAFARLARTSTSRVRSQTFVSASKLSGARDWSVITRHVVRNIAPELLTFSLLNVSVAIIVESSLNFLGLGIRPPTPTLGSMIAVGQQNIYSEPYLLIVPCAFLFVIVLALNLLGDAVRARWSKQ
jgi:peptide/nickel transport system permease protein